MASRHWNPKTGRGRWNNNMGSGNIPKRTATRIVKKAGPMDRRLFVDTDRTNTVWSAATLIPAGGTTGQDQLTLFSEADYGELALAHRERIRINTFEHRLSFRPAESGGAASGDYQVYWWYYIAGAADAQAIEVSGISPWSSTTQADYAALANVRTLKRGRFWVKFLASGAATAGRFDGANRTQHDHFCRFKKKLWLKEDEGLFFAWRWWPLLRTGISANVPAVIGSQDTLIRWARY